MRHESKWMRIICQIAARLYLRKPDQADILYIKHPGFADLWPAVMNEIAFRLRMERSFRLVGLNVELTNRCNLECSHCPRTDSGNRPPQDIDFGLFRRIIDTTPGLRTLLPYQWGEPLLSPILYDCIAYASSRGIRVMVTTNGTLLDEAACRSLLEAGLTRLTISFDGNRETQAQMRSVDPDEVLDAAKRFRSIRDRTGASCALDLSMVVDAVTDPHREEFQRLFSGIADRIQFIPRFETGRRKQPCRELWRGVLVVLSNGDVTVCCADPAGKGMLGNVKDHTLVDLFNSPAMRRLRRLHGRRDYPDLCRHCSEYSAQGVSARFS